MSRFVIQLFLLGSLLGSCNDAGDENDIVVSNSEENLVALVKQYPDSIALRNELVDYYAKNNEYEKAINENNILIQNDSKNATGWDTKARLLFLKGDTLGAISASKAAIDINPQPQYIISLGTLYAQTRNPLALSIAEALLNEPRAKSELQAYFIMGLYYNNAGRKPEAIRLFDKCLSLDYTFLDAYREKAIALYDLAKYEEAIKLLQTATTVQKTYEEGWYWMGRCYQKLNRKKEAMETYRLALQLDPGYVEASEALTQLGAKS